MFSCLVTVNLYLLFYGELCYILINSNLSAIQEKAFVSENAQHEMMLLFVSSPYKSGMTLMLVFGWTYRGSIYFWLFFDMFLSLPPYLLCLS